ncbi:MAG: sensor histidine kinase [Methylobacteriaceae bacterium]|nr:sensor histidine kinase [Methylobacteriaceae bacterium]
MILGRLNTQSIAARLYLSAAFWSLTILVVAGVILSAVYSRASIDGFDQRLGVYLRVIVADVASSGEESLDTEQLGEPQFNLALSGWYWQVTRLDTDPPGIKASRSLFAARLPRLAELGVPEDAGGARKGYSIGPDERRLRIVERFIDVGDSGRYLVQVAATTEEVDRDISRFQLSLGLTFGILALALVGTTALQVRFGLRPLRRLQEGVSAIRRGEAERIAGNYPQDIAPLASELNLLIDSNHEIVERARTQVGNLAHALKTPLSVIVNEADVEASPFGAKVREQAEVMGRQVRHYLDRARAAARAGAMGAATDVRPVVDALVRTFEKIYRDRDIGFSTEIADDVRFRGERQDLQEMIGNLVDNAGKWARRQVAVRAQRDAADRAARPFFVVVIDDDGPGLPQGLREAALQRGRRLDESKPGTGLGLSIVVELAGVYGGAFSLNDSPLGGLRAILRLPAL